MSNDEIHEQSDYEVRLRRRLEILHDKLKEGKVHFCEDLQIIESLKNVRSDPDGKIDLSTVDGAVRSMALAIEYFHDREELKASAKLSEIQGKYFEIIHSNFGKFYEVMQKRGLTPHDAGVAISENPKAVAEFIETIDEFLGFIDEFWQACGPVASAHVEDMNNCLKGVFGGDLFPSHDENIASKCSLYTDTLILPDPFLRSKQIFNRLNDSRKAYYLIKHALNLLQYRDLACAEVDVPIIVVLPDISELDEEEKEFFHAMGKRDAVVHGSRLFNRSFASFEDMLEFCKELDSIEQAVAQISQTERVLFDTEWTGTISEQLDRAAKKEVYSTVLGTTHPGLILASQAVGRMGTCNELLARAQRLRGTPIIDAPTSWQYFVWKLEYDAQRVGGLEDIKHLHAVRGLQYLASQEMRWLGRIPSSALIEIRKSGALSEIRGILGAGVEALTSANPTNFHRTSDRVFDNIHAAFSEHQKKVDALAAKKWKFAGSDIGSWLVVGSLAVTAAATGTPIWGLAALAADQLLDAPRLHEIPGSIKELAADSVKLKRSPVGMLFKMSKNTK